MARKIEPSGHGDPGCIPHGGHLLEGDIHDSTAVELAIQGQDIVLCALGINKGESAAALADGTRNIRGHPASATKDQSA